MNKKFEPVRGLVSLLMAVLSFAATMVQAADPAATPAPASTPRPRVGLVLAGGGAKGGAHVGVLRVLEEMHVPIDCIAGTSMGAVVGAGYASGISSADMTTFLLGVDWKSVVGGLGQRGMEPIEQKRQGVTYSNTLQLGVRDRHVVMAPGLVNTSGIENLLRSFVAGARSQTDFDQSADSLSGRGNGHGQRQHGGAGSRRSCHCNARQHGHTRGIRARDPGRPGPCGWWTDAQYPRGRGAQTVCGRGDRREPG